MSELQSTLDGVNRKRKIISYAVDLGAGTCLIKTEVALAWTVGGDSKCLSTSFKDVEIPLNDLPELAPVVEAIYKKIGAADEVYMATKPVEGV